MRFTIILAAAAVASAAALPEPIAADSDVKLTLSDGNSTELADLLTDVSLDKRQTPSANAQVLGDHAGTAGLAVGRILNALLNKLFPLKDWTPARETFTKQTTALMYQKNPDPRRWPAVACYNKGWRVKDYGAISDVVSMRLNLGAFHTNYDCMYVGHNNQFYTDSEGGYINLAYAYDARYCSFDGSTGDLSCS